MFTSLSKLELTFLHSSYGKLDNLVTFYGDVGSLRVYFLKNQFPSLPLSSLTTPSD